jgi:carotenoid cleavage dioxygenase-like enzyme
MGFKDHLLWLLNKLDDAVSWPDPENKYLNEVHGLVCESRDAIECTVEGKIPASVAGQFMRNGPNPKHKPNGGYHWFDGDGEYSNFRYSSARGMCPICFAVTQAAFYRVCRNC